MEVHLDISNISFTHTSSKRKPRLNCLVWINIQTVVLLYHSMILDMVVLMHIFFLAQEEKTFSFIAEKKDAIDLLIDYQLINTLHTTAVAKFYESWKLNAIRNDVNTVTKIVLTQKPSADIPHMAISNKHGIVLLN